MSNSPKEVWPKRPVWPCCNHVAKGQTEVGWGMAGCWVGAGCAVGCLSFSKRGIEVPFAGFPVAAWEGGPWAELCLVTGLLRSVLHPGCLFPLQWGVSWSVCAAGDPSTLPEELTGLPPSAPSTGLALPDIHLHACGVSTCLLSVPGVSTEKRNEWSSLPGIKYIHTYYTHIYICIYICVCVYVAEDWT